MNNMFVIVGRIANDTIIKDGYTTLEVIVQRPFKNEEGIYESDLVPVVINKTLATNIIEYCSKGDFVGVKGRIERLEDKIALIGEKLTFLSSAKKDNRDEDNNTNRTENEEE